MTDKRQATPQHSDENIRAAGIQYFEPARLTDNDIPPAVGLGDAGTPVNETGSDATPDE